MVGVWCFDDCCCMLLCVFVKLEWLERVANVGIYLCVCSNRYHVHDVKINGGIHAKD